MAYPDGAASGDSGDLSADEMLAIAGRLGVSPRTLEDWRARGLIPRPRLVGYDGKRPLWVYPPFAAKQLRAVVRWRQGSRDLDAIKVALWTEGFPIPLDEVRESLSKIVDDFERAMLRDLARFAPTEIGPDQLLTNEDALHVALAAYADELARRRSRSPLKRRVRMTLAERQRAILHMLAPFFGVEQSAQDALLAERLLGVSRGRSGTARGLLLEPPQTYVGVKPITPGEMRSAIEAADNATFAFVQAALHSFRKLMPALWQVLMPSGSALQSFVDEALDLLAEMPAQTVALFASVLITNVQRQRATEELTDETIEAVQLPTLFHEIYGALEPAQKERLTKGLGKH